MNTPVIDFHCHVGCLGAGHFQDDPERYIRIMDAAGVDRSCINCINYGDASRGNDIVAGFVERRPDRFIGVAYVTPSYPDEAVPELERAFDELGLRFLKLYPEHAGIPVDDAAYFPVFEWADDRGIAILSHASHAFDADVLTRPSRFVGLANRFQRVHWVLGHSGNSMQGQAEAVGAAQKCPNIYLETCTSMGEHGTIEYLVRGAGEDRVLYGSDMPLMDARLQVARIATANISDEAKRKVLGLNAMGLLGLDAYPFDRSPPGG